MKICQSITDKILFYNIFSSTLTTAVDSKSAATTGDNLTTVVDSKPTAAAASRLTMPKSYDHIWSGLVR